MVYYTVWLQIIVANWTQWDYLYSVRLLTTFLTLSMCTNLHKTAIATTYMRKKEEEKKNSAECLTAGLKGRGVQEGWTSYKNEILKSWRQKGRPFLCAKRWGGWEEDQPGWTQSFFWNSGRKTEFMTFGIRGW